MSAHLAKDILGAAVQSEGDLGQVCQAHGGKTTGPREEAAFDVLSDAFHVLTSPALRVERAAAGAVANEDDVARRSKWINFWQGNTARRCQR